MMKKSVML